MDTTGNEFRSIGADRTSLLEAARRSLDFFAAVCLPSVYKFAYPAFFHALWNLLITAALKGHGRSRYALGIPRGFSKTVFLKLYILYLIVFTDRQFILVVGNIASLAENILADVKDVLDSDNFRRLFGDWRLGGLEIDRLDKKKFYFNGRPIILAGIGWGNSVRGVNEKFMRPDVILMDDGQSREEAKVPEIAKEQMIWMLATLFKAASPHRCQYVFIGNMYPYDGCILRKLQESPDWISFICGAILEDGTSLWEQLRSIEDLLAEYRQDCDMGHPEIFLSEVMNDPTATSNTGLDISKILGYQPPPMEQALHGYIIIDPSVGKKKSDAIAIGAVLVFDGKPFLYDAIIDRFSQKELIKKTLELALTYGIQTIAVESTAYQATLIYWFEETFKELGIEGFNFIELYPGTASKNARIFDGLKQLTADEYRIAASLRDLVVHQIVNWNPKRTNNVDDLLDILAYTLIVWTKHRDEVALLAYNLVRQTIAAESSYSDSLAIAF